MIFLFSFFKVVLLENLHQNEMDPWEMEDWGYVKSRLNSFHCISRKMSCSKKYFINNHYIFFSLPSIYFVFIFENVSDTVISERIKSLKWGLFTWPNQDDWMNMAKPWQQQTVIIEQDQKWSWQTLWNRQTSTLHPGSS